MPFPHSNSQDLFSDLQAYLRGRHDGRTGEYDARFLRNDPYAKGFHEEINDAFKREIE